MHATTRPLIGREEQLAAIVALLDDPHRLPGTAVLWGEAGIGKTSIWLTGREAAAERGYRVLSSRPTEAETKLAYTGLADLLGGSIDSVLGLLPPIQRRALERALLLGETDAHADERAVSTAFLEALRALGAESPLYLAVDDVQWLDAESLAGLRFALPRVARLPVAAVLATRGEPPAWLRRGLDEERLRTIEVGGLSVGELFELLRTRLDAVFPRPTLLRIWETSRGNPFFALELAGALQRRGTGLATGDALPIPSDLHELLRERLASLADPALQVLRTTAALADPTMAVVEAAVGPRFDTGLAQALDAKVVELDEQRLRLTHPLLGSAVTAEHPPSRLRALHARLARIVSNEEERARHLALAAAEPSRETAAILEEAAQSSHARGATATAAELAEQALRLTPDGRSDDARRRLLDAADLHRRAGDTERATALLEQARAAAASAGERALVLSRLAGVQASPHAAVGLYREALEDADGDDVLQATIHLGLAGLMRFTEGIERGMEHGELAALAAARVGDPALRCRALAAYGLMRFNLGRGVPIAEMNEALTLERSLAEWPLDDGPTWAHGWQLCWLADVDRARDLFREVLSVVRERNDAAGEAEALWYLGLLEARAASWAAAARYSAASLDLWTQLGRVVPYHEFPAAVSAAHRGRIDEARARSRQALARAEAEGIDIGQSGHSWVLGFVELSTGDAAAALPHLRRAYALRDAFMLEPAQRLELGDLLEALIAAGELDEAEGVLLTWEPRAAALDRAWALAILARGGALLLAGQGDLEGAFARFEEALVEHARAPDPFQHARTLLALGRTLRRAKRRGDARTTLDDALVRFETLGAPLWAEQTRAELARIGGRAPSRNDLTEAEQRIAALVAQGRTNREVAAALYLTPHSVETALTRVYRKLGVRSRVELARTFAKS